MDNLSKMDRSGNVSPTAGPLWHVHKKNRMGDHKEREGKREKRKNKKFGENALSHEELKEERTERKDSDYEEEYGYGSKGTKKSVRPKIDLMI